MGCLDSCGNGRYWHNAIGIYYADKLTDLDVIRAL